MTTLHITNGDSAVHLLQKAGVEGVFLPWRDLLHEGPVPAGLDFASLCQERGRYLARAGYGGSDDVHQSFKELLSIIAQCEQYSRIVLWFEHDLYDQLQLLQVLDELDKHPAVHDRLFMIQTHHYLGESSVSDVETFKTLERPVSGAQRQLAKHAWHAFRQPSPQGWHALLDADTNALAYLGFAVERLLEEFPDCRDGLGRTQRQAMLAVADGVHQPGRIFGHSQNEEDRRFLGDLSFYRMLRELMQQRPPLLQQTAGPPLVDKPSPSQQLSLTSAGEAILNGDDSAKPFDQGKAWWMGGTKLSAGNRWYWNPAIRNVSRKPCF